jgi:hypothetical protein
MTTTTTEPKQGNKSRRYREQVLDESFFGEQVEWTGRADAWLLSLHTGDPEDKAGLLTNEIAYPGYQRVRLPRDRLTWARTGNRLVSRIDARFALNQSDLKTKANWWALTPSGFAYPAYTGRLARPIQVELGVRPVVDAGLIDVLEI